MTEDRAITADDMKFLRWAREKSNVSLYVAWHLEDRTGFVRVTVTHTVHVPGMPEGNRVETSHQLSLGTAYVANYHGREGNTVAALNMGTTMRGEHAGCLNNLMSMGLRTGDQLRAVFLIGNDTEPLRNAGFTHDQAFLGIDRDGKFRGEAFVDDRVYRLATTASNGMLWTRTLANTPDVA
jgi:hypothetical protein